MAREFSEDVRIRVKDGLRELRSIVRQHRHDHTSPVSTSGDGNREQPFPVREIEGLLGHAISAFDDAMTVAERLAPRRDPARLGAPGPQPLQSYFRNRDEARLDGARAFRRDLYRLAKLALEQKQFSDFRVREIDFAMVHEALEKREAERITLLRSETTAEEREILVAGLTASLFLQLERQRPIRLAAHDSGQEAGAVVSVLAAIAIACGLATLNLEGAPASELMEIAILAVDVRADRIHASMASDDAQAALTGLFATLLAHLN